ncbi:hypothetical protein M0802_011709 [Mischocyttarus mexicanus]|nr:hypothetical protein M0802_011709 [Mischocyttarus mexicanus]
MEGDDGDGDDEFRITKGNKFKHRLEKLPGRNLRRCIVCSKKNNAVIRRSHLICAACKKDVAEQLLQAVCIPDYKKRGTMSVGSIPNRLEATQWGHFPRNIPPTNAKKKPQRRCRVCTEHKKRSETVWEFTEKLSLEYTIPVNERVKIGTNSSPHRLEVRKNQLDKPIRRMCIPCYQKKRLTLDRNKARKNVKKPTTYCAGCPESPQMCSQCFNDHHNNDVPPLPEYKGRGRLSGGFPQRLNAQRWAHFPKHIDPTPSKSKPSRACKVCSRHRKRSETTWECKR